MKSIIFLESAQNFGGARIAIVDLAERLQTYYDCSIVDVSGTCPTFIDYCRQKKVKLHILSPSDVPKIFTSKRRVFKIIKIIKYIPEYLRVRKEIKQYVSSHHVDYICVSSLRTLSYLYNLQINAHVCFFAQGWYIRKQISPFLKWLFKQTVDTFICVSQATKQALYNNSIAPLERLFVAHIGIDELKLRKDVAKIVTKPECVKILHSAGFSKSKGQLISIEIAKQLKKSGFNFKLILTGIIYKGIESQSYYTKIINKIKEYGLQDEVDIVVGQPNVIHYFRACDILIHPSESEGFGMVVLEAMTLKKPVIANAVGGITDMIINKYTGFLTRQNNVADYVRYITLLANDKQLYSRIADNAYSMVINTYTIEQQVESWIQAIDNE